MPGLTRTVPGLTRIVPGLTRIVPGLTQIVPGLTRIVTGLTRIVPGLTRIVPGLTQIVPGLTRIVTGLSVRSVRPNSNSLVVADNSSSGRAEGLSESRKSGKAIRVTEERAALPNPRRLDSAIRVTERTRIAEWLRASTPAALTECLDRSRLQACRVYRSRAKVDPSSVRAGYPSQISYLSALTSPAKPATRLPLVLSESGLALSESALAS